VNYYGITGTTWSRPGCAGALVIIALSWFLALVVVGVLTPAASGIADSLGMLTPGVSSTIYFVAFHVGAIGFPILGFHLHKRLTTRTAWWCDRCGVPTEPRFDICRSCGRVKRQAQLPTT
jgi:hypothetical protein